MDLESKILLQEENIISLRTALIVERGGKVILQLLPLSTKEGFQLHGAALQEWLWSCSAWLFQDLPATTGWPDRNVKHMKFEKPPEFRLLWSDSGNFVAVYLNCEPWAFVDEETKKAYSKGILSSTPGGLWGGAKSAHSWDQKAFENTFLNENEG